jgi:hypothetical protein
MRRSIVAAAACLGLTLSAQAASSQAAAPQAVADPTPVTDGQARQALAAARAALSGDTPGSARRTSHRRDATLALRDLFTARAQLSPDDRRQADGMLARPTDAARTRPGGGYTVPATRTCKKHFCLHWVTTTADAPPGSSWVTTNLRLMNRVWRAEVDKLGYRKPISDKRRGGKKGKVDVYLKDLGAQGLYGYCAPERRTENHKWLASGYCVLDNDFAAAQYGGVPPKDSLRVTAAHEFFHLVQFAYDYGEDGWMMESTATWMEERVADGVDDNRQYLPAGQVGVPASPLDAYHRQGFNQYGNWPFWEYLSSHYGNGIVKSIWGRAGEFDGAQHEYSTKAVRGGLAEHGGFLKVFRAYAGGNTVPGKTYPEGSHWTPAPAVHTWSLTRARPRAATETTIDHMASRNVAVRPAADMKGKRWKLLITIDAPGRKKSPTAYVVVKKRDGVARHPVSLSEKGTAQVDVAFGSTRVRSVVVTLVNASTRFDCWQRTSSTCQGRAKDNGETFHLGVRAHRVERKHRP